MTGGEIAAIVAAVFSGIAGLIGAVKSFYDVKKIKDENAAIRREHDRLNESHLKLIKIMQEGDQRYNELEKKFCELQKSYDMLLRAYRGLNAKYQKSEAENRELQAKYDLVKAQYDQLRKDYDGLSAIVRKSSTGPLKDCNDAQG